MTAQPRQSSLSMPRLFLHLEGAALFIASLIVYASLDFGWGLLAILILVPDLSLLLYAANPRIASIVYNLLHTSVFSMALAAYGLLTGMDLAMQIALIWFAHIGIDRAVGYGLKYTGEKASHFSTV